MFGFFKSKPKVTSSAVGPAVFGNDSSQVAAVQAHPFKKHFDHELDSWCFGLENLGENPLPQVIFKVVREFRLIFQQSLENGLIIDIDHVARRLFAASGQVVPVKELAMALVAILPSPENLPLEQKRTYALILAQVEQSHSGAVDRVKQRLHAVPTMTKDQEVDSVRQSPQAPLLLAERA